MSPELLRMVIDRDEVGLERAYFDNKCPHFFAVDGAKTTPKSSGAAPSVLIFHR
jgi:hypothetical protein